MPIAGQQVPQAQRTAAIRDITRTFGHAAYVSSAFADKTLSAQAEKPFELVPVSQRTVDAWVKESQGRVIWANEYNCWNRAADRAHSLIGKTGVGTSPMDDAFAAGIVHYEHAHAVDSDFHAAVAFKIQGKDGIWALDLLAPRVGPVPLQEWSFGAPVVLRRPWAGTGVGDSARYVNEYGYRYSRDMLINTWTNAAEHGVQILP